MFLKSFNCGLTRSDTCRLFHRSVAAATKLASLTLHLVLGMASRCFSADRRDLVGLLSETRSRRYIGPQLLTALWPSTRTLKQARSRTDCQCRSLGTGVPLAYLGTLTMNLAAVFCTRRSLTKFLSIMP